MPTLGTGMALSHLQHWLDDGGVSYCHYGTGQPSTAYQLGGLPKFIAG